MGQITGRAYIKSDGNLLRSREGSKLGLGNPAREGVVGDTGVHGYKEKNQIPFVECEISHDTDTSLSALAAITDATITFESDNGKTYVMRNAWLANSLELEASEGKVALRFEGMACEEA